MSMKVTDRLIGKGRGDPTTAIANVKKGVQSWLFKPELVTSYFTTIHAVGPAVGLDPAIVGSAASHETGKFTSSYAISGNFAGIGITFSGQTSPFSLKDRPEKERGYLGALVQMAALLVRIKVIKADDIPNELHPVLSIPGVKGYLDRVYNLFSLYRTPVLTIDDLNKRFGPNDSECTWACDPEYQDHIIDHARFLYGTLPDQEPAAVLQDPTIIVIAGHNAVGDTGNPAERERTAPLANAIVSALKDAGYKKVIRIADGNPGGLDGVSRFVLETAQKITGDLVVLDIHLEGAAARGVFAIYPRSDGLRTAIQVPGQGNDAQGNNSFDELFGEALAKSISASTGLSLRSSGVVRPGLMGEHQTGVAGQFGARLATFAYTAPLQPRAVRLVVEHGSLPTEDRKIIDTATFGSRVGAGYVKTFKEFFPVTTIPKPKGFPAYDGRDHDTFKAIKRIVHAGPNGAKLRTHGTSDKGAVVGSVAAGKEIHVIYKAGRYWINADGYRIYQNDVVEKVSFA